MRRTGHAFRATCVVKLKRTMWSSGATLLALLLVFVRPALGDPCVLTMGSQYQLKSDTVDWTMQTSSGQSCIRGLRHKRVTIDSAKLISPPQSGQVKLLGSGFSYTAKSDFEGQDSFTIQVSGMLNGVRGSSDIRIIVSVGPNVSPQTSPTERSDRPPADLSSAAQPNKNPSIPAGNSSVTVTAKNAAGTSAPQTQTVAATQQPLPVTGGVHKPGPSQALFDAPYYKCNKNVYVNGTNGNDSAAGTQAAPWKTLKKANDSNPGAAACVIVAAGTYNGFTVNHGGNAATATGYLTYRCEEMDACTINGNGYNGTIAVHFSFDGLSATAANAPNNYVIFDGFILKSNGGTFYPIGFNQYNGDNSNKIAAHHIWFLNGVVHGFGQSGLSMCCADYHYVMHSTFYNNSRTQCDAQGSGLAVNTEHDLPGYTPTADDKKPNAVFGFPTWEIGDGTFFHIVQAFNVVYNNGTNKCGSANNKYDSDGNGIIYDTNDLNNTVPFHHPMLAYGNITYNNGGSAIHVFQSCNIWQANNSAFNSYLDPYNGVDARGTLSESGGTTSCPNRFYNNISVAIAATRPSSGCNYTSGSPLQWNSALLTLPQSGSSPAESNMTFMIPPNAGCNGEVSDRGKAGLYDKTKNFMSTDPQWVDVGKQNAGNMEQPPAGINFALQPTSPARGKGKVQPWMPATAIDLGACPSSLTVCP